MPRTLPTELVDTIIDAIAFQDRPSLGSCACVSSSWLPRSRFHRFSTLKLTPSRATSLVTLFVFEGSQSNLHSFISHIELDGNLRPPKCRRGNDDAMLEQMAFLATVQRDTQALMKALMSIATANLHLASLTLQNIDFTLIPPKQLVQLQESLASSSFTPILEHLSFTEATFQNFKQLHSFIHLFPKLGRVTLGKRVAFLRFQDTACIEAASLPWKASLREIHIEDEQEERRISEIILAWIASSVDSGDESLRFLQKLAIEGFKEPDLSLLQRAMERVAPHLQCIDLRATENITSATQDTLSQMASLSPGCQLRLSPVSSAELASSTN